MRRTWALLLSLLVVGTAFGQTPWARRGRLETALPSLPVPARLLRLAFEQEGGPPPLSLRQGLRPQQLQDAFINSMRLSSGLGSRSDGQRRPQNTQLIHREPQRTSGTSREPSTLLPRQSIARTCRRAEFVSSTPKRSIWSAEEVWP